MAFCPTERMQNPVLLKMSNTKITEDICYIHFSSPIIAPHLWEPSPLFFLNPPADSTLFTRDGHMTLAWPIEAFHPPCHSDSLTDAYMSQDRPMRFSAKTFYKLLRKKCSPPAKEAKEAIASGCLYYHIGTIYLRMKTPQGKQWRKVRLHIPDTIMWAVAGSG